MSIDHQQAFDGTGAIRTGHGFDVAALDAWLTANVPGYAGPLSVKQFNGGQSNPTYRLDTPGADYVLRRKPPGPILPGAHAIEREHRVISALHAANFPVARPYALCEDDRVIGTPFYVMAFVPGRIFWNSTMPGLDPAERAAHFDAMNATIARLHTLDIDALGLSSYGKPGNYFERQLARWSRQYREDADAGRNEHLDRLIDWLGANVPSGDEATLVHGDLRGDNFMFDPAGPRVAAVLDWELSTLGHPIGDFTYHLMMYRLPPDVLGGFAGADLTGLGIPSESDYIAAYCRRTGRDHIDALDFYLAFNMFRFAAILHGVKGRLIRGNAASATAQSLVETLPKLARIGWEQTRGR
ncbi:phosphotransferase family protein [uncultured Sphingomonas sp.]|uniref:phosphotransferase family protein n=1 Tax=uncultured Sphingomonas sp. TaxID=158754 RepID=UPI0025F945DA|nr:phosphotransferase family protein [uncultured Sphingomonas sp.]